MAVALTVAPCGRSSAADVDTLEFTLPAFQSQGCAAGPDSIREPLEWAVGRRVQSPAWIAMAPAMKADPGVWAAIWPIVRAEAEPVPVAQGGGVAGRRVVAVLVDTTKAVHWWSVSSRNGRGWGCTSRVVRGK